MRVLVAAGASGGHIFPALSFLEALKKKHKGIDTFLVLPKRSRKNQIIPDTDKIKYISTSSVKLSFNLRNFVAILNLFRGSLESLFLLVEFKPDIVLGFGTIDCVPLVLFAWLFRIKTLIHEQNVIPGRANRLLAKFADKIALSFIQTKGYLNVNPEKIALTGNPIRSKLKKVNKREALNFFGFNADKFTILVMGGSQGSQRVNQGFLKSISAMPDKNNLQVIHLTGVKELDSLNKGYKDLNIRVKLFAFLSQMQYAYSVSDLVICRAGATTIAELIDFAVPAILIPYPFARKHQLSNARVLERKGCAIIIRDEDLDNGILKEAIRDLIDRPGKIDAMRRNYGEISRFSASERLANEALSLVLA